MNRSDIENLRGLVSCARVLELAGFALDKIESTRRALKFRRGAEIIIVTNGGAGWFDPLSDRKGDVFALAIVLRPMSFPQAVEEIVNIVGLPQSAVRAPVKQLKLKPLPIDERWNHRRRIGPGNTAFSYLLQHRLLPACLLLSAATRSVVRQGPYGSAWFRHDDECGRVIGWEERGPGWRGFATGGAKELFRFGPVLALRICVTEAAIDAMSLAALEDLRGDTLYVSTGGGWAPRTQVALECYAVRPEVHLVAATDANVQGEIYADRIRQMANAGGCDFSRLRPKAEDWNEELKEGREWGGGGGGEERGDAMAPDVRRIKGKASPAAGGP